MTRRRCWWLLLLGLIGASQPTIGASAAAAQEMSSPFATPIVSPSGRKGPPALPLASLTPQAQHQLRQVVDHASLTASGQPEAFNSSPELYAWLLEYPAVAVKLWQTLGAKVSDIEERNGRYKWTDDQGSEVWWHIALRAPGLHVWYAEGKVKPALLVPMTAFRAVVVLEYTLGKDTKGKQAIRHQAHFIMRSDSRALSLATRLLGKQAPRMTEQYLGQLQTFYGGMAWYLGQDEERARKMYRQVGLPTEVKASR